MNTLLWLDDVRDPFDNINGILISYRKFMNWE